VTPEVGLRDPRFVRLLRWVCVGFAVSSFALAGYILFVPDALYAALGVGGNVFVQALYSGAIAGEGFMFARCARWPGRYVVFFEYMVVYKLVACLGASAVLLRAAEAPVMAWGLVGGWAFAGFVSVWVVLRSR
jgi:hypothetical protein